MEMNEHSPAILEKELSTYLIDQAPYQLPLDFKEGFVKYAPYVLLVLLVISALAVIPLAFAIVVLLATGNIYSVILAVFGVISMVFTALALPGLFAQKRGGWVLWYYGDLIGIVSGILSISVVGILLNILFLYIMFQVKSYYK